MWLSQREQIHVYCVVPEKIHTHPTEDHWNSKGGGGGVGEAKILEAKYEAKLEFLGGEGCVKLKKPFMRGV